MHVNLLPDSFIWRQFLRKRLRQWTLAFCVVGTAFLVGNIPLLRRWWIEQREIQILQLAAEPARQLQAKNIEIVQQTREMEGKLKHLHATIPTDRTTSLLGLIALGVGTTKGGIQVQDIQFNLVDKVSSASTPNGIRPSSLPAPKSSLHHHVQLQGLAAESESISRFIESLRDAKVFPKVELRSTQERLISDRTVQEFRLEFSTDE